jgi:nucleoside 2-deoxyribosyltransferase
MKIYLASRYSRFPEMQGYRAELESLGHTVTSRWIDGHQLDDSHLSPELEKIRFAQEDRADLIDADCVISFTEEPRTLSTSRGGRHVEFGMAIALDKRVIVVGHRENVFHSLPGVEFFESWKDALRHLDGRLAILEQVQPVPAALG